MDENERQRIYDRLIKLERNLANLVDFASWTTAAVFAWVVYRVTMSFHFSYDTGTVIGVLVFIFSGMWFRNLATK